MQRKIADKNLIWQSQDHLLIVIPSENINQEADSFYFLRVTKDINQIQVEMRFKNSSRLPWLSSDYHAISKSFNHLAEAIAIPAAQYRQARSQRNSKEVEKFHTMVLRLYDRILKEIELKKFVDEQVKEPAFSTVVCTNEIEGLLNALDEID